MTSVYAYNLVPLIGLLTSDLNKVTRKSVDIMLYNKISFAYPSVQSV